MAEFRRGIASDNRVERLPWLEPVEDEDDYPEAGAARGWAVLGLGLLALVALVTISVVVLRRWQGAHAEIGGIIHAPATPYKVKPADGGGLAVDAGGVVAERTGTGDDVDAPLALVAPETPVVGAGSRPAEPTATPTAAQPHSAPTLKAAPVVLPAPKPVIAAATAPKAGAAGSPVAVPAPAGGGGTVQLGAFGSEAKAKTAWKSLSKRFGYLQPMAFSITPAEVNGTTYYRLRASGGEAASQICARLQVAGEACTVVG